MNYYNEFDPNAAAWLKQLIQSNLIPQGEVDTRSITEVKPHELTGYTQCHFFAGIGGWSYALQLAGWPTDRPVFSGSCPCQPFSSAGKGLGAADERHLWPAFFNLIKECRPQYVFGEQVASAIGHGWLDGISADLGEEGYACGSAVLGAHSVGAPHIRQRLYWMAYDSSERLERSTGAQLQGNSGGFAGYSEACSRLGDTNGERHDGQHPLLQRNESRRNEEDLLEASWPCESSWSRYDLIPCRDGKQRRIPGKDGAKPSFLLLADGFYYRLASVLTELSAQANQQVNNYAKEAGTTASETLQMVRQTIAKNSLQSNGPEAVRQVGGFVGIQEEEILFNSMRDVLAASEQSTIDSGSQQKEGAEIYERVLRDLRIAVSTECASLRRESNEQSSGKPSDPLLELSQFLACCVKASESFRSRANAFNFPLSAKTAGRVTALRGLGNAIVPQVAAVFIQASTDAIVIQQDIDDLL